MTELIMLLLTSTLVSAQAMNTSSVSPAPPCKDNQRCSQCDITAEDCLECTTGYFDTRCSSVCNKNCLKRKCTLSSNGNGNCTDGCVSGYQGTDCNIPCDNPGGICTACPSGCDGGYCQLGSSCVSGCVDSYYGTDCKTCSSRCKSCNRTAGECTECHAPYVGPKCECPSCNGTLEDCEMGGCKHASYGNDDQKTGSVLTWLLASLLLLVSGILLILCLCYCKRFPKQRCQEYITPTQDMHVSPEAIGVPVYDVVDEAKMYDALTDEGQQASGAGYVELRSQEYITPTQDMHVSPEAIGVPVYDVVDEAKMYDALTDEGQQASGAGYVKLRSDAHV